VYTTAYSSSPRRHTHTHAHAHARARAQSWCTVFRSPIRADSLLIQKMNAFIIGERCCCPERIKRAAFTRRIFRALSRLRINCAPPRDVNDEVTNAELNPPLAGTRGGGKEEEEEEEEEKERCANARSGKPGKISRRRRAKREILFLNQKEKKTGKRKKRRRILPYRVFHERERL